MPDQKQTDFLADTSTRDLVSVISITLITYALSMHYDLAEEFNTLIRHAEDYELDEFFVALFVLCLCLCWYGYRRWFEIRRSWQLTLALHTALSTMNRRTEQLLNENRELMSHVVMVQENERDNLARELHDVFGQHLAAIDANLSSLTQVRDMPDQALPVISATLESTGYLRDIIRSKLRSLKPPTLHSLGLSGAVHDLLADWQKFHRQFVLDVSIRLDDTCISEQVALTAYRVVQEGLMNIARHSQASRISLIIRQQTDAANAADRKLNIHLRDNGIGIGTDAIRNKGLGLIGIRERCHVLQGRLSIDSTPGKGTTIEVSLPCNDEGSPDYENTPDPAGTSETRESNESAITATGN